MSSESQNSGRMIGGVVLVAAGALFFLVQFLGLDGSAVIDVLWPLFILGPGAVMLLTAIFNRTRLSGMAIPGSILSGIGGLLMYQSVTGDWDSWAYAWALIPCFVGIGLSLAGTLNPNPGQVAVGNRMAVISLVVFAVFAMLFDAALTPLLPLLLIGLGVFMLFGRNAAPRMESSKLKNEESPVFTGPIMYGTKGDRPITYNKQKNSAVDDEELPLDTLLDREPRHKQG